MQKQNWYLVKLIYCIDVNFGSNKKQFDEQLRLLEAINYTEAIIKAKMFGVKNEFEINQPNANHVKWSFIDILEIKQLDNFTDGIELCSKIDEQEESDNFIAFIKAKAKNLELKYLPQPVNNF